MRQHGRRSTANLSVIPLRRAAKRLRSPPGLTAAEQELFDEVLASVPQDHFAPGDRFLVVAYVQAVLVARSAVKNLPTEAPLWDRAVKQMTALATKLRLSPSSRVDPKVAGRRIADFQPPEWMVERDEQ